MILRTFEDGIAAFLDSVTSPEALAAIGLSLRVAALAVLINTVFGLTSALLLTRYRFRPERAERLDRSAGVGVPVVAGLALILVYGRNGWFGGSLQDLGIQVIYAEPAIVLAPASSPASSSGADPGAEEIGLEQSRRAGR